jgi:flagellar FliL protein
MAKDDKKDDREDEADEGEEKPKAASGGRKKLILIIVAVLGLVGVSVGGTMLVSSLLTKEEPAKKVAKKKAPAAGEEEKEEGAAKEGEEKEGAEKPEAEAEEEDDTVNPDGSKRVATYFDFEQPFVVNFMDEGQLRYLQITVSVMYMDPKTLEEIKRHSPLIRNNLVMLFSNQSRDVIITREGKEKIRIEAEAEVKKVLLEKAGKPYIKSLYFTSFVMQ